MLRRTLFALAVAIPFAPLRRRAGFQWKYTEARGWTKATLVGYSPVSGVLMGLSVKWIDKALAAEVNGALARCHRAVADYLAYERAGIYDPRVDGRFVRPASSLDRQTWDRFHMYRNQAMNMLPLPPVAS